MNFFKTVGITMNVHHMVLISVIVCQVGLSLVFVIYESANPHMGEFKTHWNWNLTINIVHAGIVNK